MGSGILWPNDMRELSRIHNSPGYKPQLRRFLNAPVCHDNGQPGRRAVCRSAGFTLLEVLVALVIVGTALGASMRAIGSLTQNSSDLRASMVAAWSAENRLAQIRLAREWPALGQRSFNCAQGELQLVCEENVFATPNPFFRRVEVSVLEMPGAGEIQVAGEMQDNRNMQNTGRRIIKLAQVVPNVR